MEKKRICIDHFRELPIPNTMDPNLYIVSWAKCDICRRDLFARLEKIEIAVQAILTSLEQGVTVKEYEGPDMVDY